jgi:hypothetical protein
LPLTLTILLTILTKMKSFTWCEGQTRLWPTFFRLKNTERCFTGYHEAAKGYSKEFEKINTERKSLQSGSDDDIQHSKKRKRENSDDAAQSMTKSNKETPPSHFSHLEKQRSTLLAAQRAAKQSEVELQTQVSSWRLQVLQECIGARNRWVKNRLQADFATGQAQLIQKAKQLRMSGSGNGGTIAKCNGNWEAISSEECANFEETRSEEFFRIFAYHWQHISLSKRKLGKLLNSRHFQIESPQRSHSCRNTQWLPLSATGRGLQAN